MRAANLALGRPCRPTTCLGEHLGGKLLTAADNYVPILVVRVSSASLQRLRIEYDTLDKYRQEQELTIAKLSSKQKARKKEKQRRGEAKNDQYSTKTVRDAKKLQRVLAAKALW